MMPLKIASTPRITIPIDKNPICWGIAFFQKAPPGKPKAENCRNNGCHEIEIQHFMMKSGTERGPAILRRYPDSGGGLNF
jgi:hypothetical protein